MKPRKASGPKKITNNTNPEAKARQFSEPQMKKLQALKEKGEKILETTTELVSTVAGDKYKDLVPKYVVAKARKVMDAFEAVSMHASQVLTTGAMQARMPHTSFMVSAGGPGILDSYRY